MLRVVARHADAWNVPGPPWNTVEDIQARSQILDQHCADLGRDPATIERSVQVMVRRDTVDETRDALARLVDVGVTHLVLAPVPHTADAVRWLADDVVSPLRDELPVG